MDMVPRSRLNAVENELEEAKQKLLSVQKNASDEIYRLRWCLCACKNAIIVSNKETDWTNMIDHLAKVLSA